MAQPIGILGGTFDPIHHGHLRLAIECVESIRLAEVRLVPVHAPPHRQAPVASAAQRMRMVEIAAAGVPGVRPDDREILRGGVSYTVETLKSLRDESGSQPVSLIVGMDAFRLIHTWRQWTSLLDFAHIIVVDRPGGAPAIGQAGVARLLEERLVQSPEMLRNSPAGAILRVDVPLLDISSTRIRTLIAAGRNVQILLPDKVIEFIQGERLYRNGA